jgi:hypothetical protein
VLRNVAIGSGLALLAACLWFALLPSPEERLADLVAELRARGEPVSLAEMEPPMPPDDQNGAHDIDAAMAWFAENEPEGDWGSRMAGPWNNTLRDGYEDASPEQRQALAEFLSFLQPFFELVDRGVEKPEIAWALPERKSAEDVLDSLRWAPTIQSLQRFLYARARYAGTEAERRRGIRSLLLLSSRTRVRTNLDHLTAASGFRSGCRILHGALAESRIDPLGARASLDEALRTHWDARYPALVRGQRAYELECIPFWIDGSLPKALGQGPPPTGWETFLEGLKQLRKGRWRFEARGSPAARVRWAVELGQLLEPGMTFEDTFTQAYRLRNSPALIISRIRERLGECDVQAALARIALAAYEHRRLHGAWPEGPDELGALFPEGVPVDGFSGEPVTFERVDDGLGLRTQLRRELFGDETPFELGLEWRLPPRD